MDAAAEEIPPEEELVEQEESLAAAEAGQIGGRSGMEGMDEAERASAEHGGGSSEGFEEAEALHEQHAAHGESFVHPLLDRPAPEAEPDPGVYGEADEIESTEKHDDAAST